MAKNKHPHSQKEEWGVRQGKMRPKKRPTPSRANTKSCSSMSSIWCSSGLQRALVVPALQLGHLQHTQLLSWAGSTPVLQLPLGKEPQFRHLQHPGVHTKAWTSFSHLHIMASQGLLTEIPTRLHIAWSWCFLEL